MSTIVKPVHIILSNTKHQTPNIKIKQSEKKDLMEREGIRSNNRNGIHNISRMRRIKSDSLVRVRRGRKVINENYSIENIFINAESEADR